MKIFLIILLIPFLSFIKSIEEGVISNVVNSAAVPSFTNSPDGKIILSWVETEKISKKVSFFYSIYDGYLFGEKIKVPIVDSASTHAEGMPRLAIKKDGSMIVTFELKKDNPTSRFGSDLLYVYSKDGKNWSAPDYVQSDRNPNKSHSFSRTVRLADGEIGVVWLDEKLTSKGRSVKFAKTSVGKGFGEPKVIDNQACECCRIEAIIDPKGVLHIFYRDVYEDESRDMSYIFSKDDGESFSEPRNVYPDKWQVNACPHAGPSATVNTKGIWMTWFTGKENAAGIKVCDVETGKIINTALSTKVRSPQITSTKSGNSYLTYSEIKNQGEEYFKSIALRKLSGNAQTIYLSKSLEDCSYPSIISFENDLILAYERKIGEQNTVITWKKVKF
ncbi:sialidase family protein [Emticicia sp. SJ17W-69]|uniref:sialidase family protein n=1 Tax=Emticicia sp. SJ17W-69 TaxID=3421657 RepID=UPI003EB8726E